MTFFDLSRPIILRTEAGFKEGLLAALLQKTDKGSTLHQPNDDRPKKGTAKPKKMPWPSNG